MPSRQMHREVFFANNGMGPYQCFACGRQVEFYDSFPVHHIDWNHSNNSPDNLAAMHWECHTRLHRLGYTASEKTRTKISAASKGRRNSPEHRAAISKAHLGKPRTQAVKDKISESHKQRNAKIRASVEAEAKEN